MASYTFKELVSAYKSGIISETLFEKRLSQYIQNIFVEASKNQSHQSNHIITPTQTLINSIVDRICLTIFEDPNEFYNVTNIHKQINEINGINQEGYEVFRCSEPKVVLGNIKTNQLSKTLNVSIGLETGTLFLSVHTKKIGRSGDELSVCTYALADNHLIKLIDQRNNTSSPISDNYIDNCVVCTRFDPSHMNNNNNSGFRQDSDNHPNRYNEAGITDNIELGLYQQYFKQKARCPHFHFFTKKVCRNLHSNNASFAINIKDLENYLTDLEVARNSNNTSNPIFKYDLGMPFLDIAKENIHCDMQDFIKTAKGIIQKYYGGYMCQGINLLYEMLDHSKRNDSLSLIVAGSKFLNFVYSTPTTTLERNKETYPQQLNNDRENIENLELTTTLANAFINDISQKIDASKILKNFNNKDDEPGGNE